jgi:hypothetical protein
MGTATGTLAVSVPAGGMALYCVRPQLSRPVVLGIAKTLSMGNTQFEQTNYDRSSNVLVGTTIPSRGIPLELRVLVPEDVTAHSVTVSEGHGTLVQDGRLVRVTIAEARSAVSWQIQF